MMDFFKDFATLTPVAHLIKYWWVWLVYVGIFLLHQNPETYRAERCYRCYFFAEQVV